jgi:CBS domain-containing protein
MRIHETLPHVFRRTYPVLEPGTQMILAVSLLRFHQIDALPIGFKPNEKRKLAVFGYSCLSRLLETDPKDYTRFLEMPCERAALELSTISIDGSIQELLDLFENTRFGFAWVESDRLGGFTSLRDLLELYKNGAIATEMTAGEVASPIFSMPKESNLKTVLEEMFHHRFRRVFPSDEKKNGLVTDRRIISYIFSASRLSEASKRPQELLDATLGDLHRIEPGTISERSPLKVAALSMNDSNEDCLVCEKGVITPWDLVMKPLAVGQLKIAS